MDAPRNFTVQHWAAFASKRKQIRDGLQKRRKLRLSSSRRRKNISKPFRHGVMVLSPLLYFLNALRPLTVQHSAACASNETNKRRPSETAEAKAFLIARYTQYSSIFPWWCCYLVLNIGNTATSIILPSWHALRNFTVQHWVAFASKRNK